MSSRAKILAAVKANLPESTQLPEIGVFNSPAKPADPSGRFIEMALSVSSNARAIKRIAIADFFDDSYGTQDRLFSTSKYWSHTNDDFKEVDHPHDLKDVDVAVIDARLGVIENGAVWVDEDCLNFRALPFICQHLVVLLKAEDLVENMHDAYALINKDPMPSYGLFIGGPSKTADIEQALVLGAHGPLTNTILLVE